MACEGLTPIEYWMQMRFVDGAVCYYGDQIGVLAFMFLFFGATFISLYQASGSVMLPVAVLVVLAPLVVVLIPALGIQFIAVVMLVMSAIGGYMIYRSVGA